MAELSGFEVLALVKEIDLGLRETYVNNIYTIGDAQLVRLRKPGGEEALLVVAPAFGVWLSSKLTERGETSEFTTKLRGELERTRFSAARQVDLDRVFELSFGEGDSARRLVVEMMPPGNVVVTDGSGKIVLLKAEVRTPLRRLVKGGVYSPPVQRKRSPASLTEQNVRELAAAEKTVGTAFGRNVSVPRKYVAEALFRLSLTEDAPSSALSGRESEVAGVFRSLVRDAEQNPRPCLCETSKGEEMFAFRPKAFPVKREAATLSALCDEVLLSDLLSGAKAEESEEELRLRELEVTLSKLKKEEQELAIEASRLRQAAASAGRAETVAEAKKTLLEAGVKPKKEPNSQAAAASVAYDKAKEVDSRAAEVKKAAERLSRKVPRTTGQVKPHTKQLPRRKLDWYEKFRWFYTAGGKLAVGGRDAQSNSTLIRRHTDDNDVVYHADLFGSPFFILKGGREQTEEETREVAQATVAFSSAWKTGLGSADAYWVNPDQVGTAAPSGEYLARGSFAIKGKKNFVTGNLVEVAVGVDRSGRVVAGPETAVSRMAAGHVVVRPHREKGSETAKRVLKDLEKLGGGTRLALDDVMRALPSGGGKVVRSRPGSAEGSVRPA